MNKLVRIAALALLTACAAPVDESGGEPWFGTGAQNLDVESHEDYVVGTTLEAFVSAEEAHVLLFTMGWHGSVTFETKSSWFHDQLISADTVLVLLGPDGEQIAMDDDGGEESLSRLEATLGPGTYSLMVRGNADTEFAPFRLESECSGYCSPKPPLFVYFDPDLRPLGLFRAPKDRVIAASTTEDLKRIVSDAGPTGTLYIGAHGVRNGDMKLGNRLVSPEAFARDLEGVRADVDNVDFQGCSIGASPDALDSIRRTLSAQRAVAPNCFHVMGTTRFHDNGTPVTREWVDRSPQRRRPIAEEYLQDSIASLDPYPLQDCVLTPTLDEFFRAGNRLITSHYNHFYESDWGPGSVCSADLTPEPPSEETGCRLVEVVGD